MDCPVASCVNYISGIIHRCLCRFWRSPFALNILPPAKSGAIRLRRHKISQRVLIIAADPKSSIVAGPPLFHPPTPSITGLFPSISRLDLSACFNSRRFERSRPGLDGALSLVTRRPIAWVTSLSLDGHLNAAPFSFFNALGANPPIIGFCPGDRDDRQPKDTALNVRATHEFVVNLVDEAVELWHSEAILSATLRGVRIGRLRVTSRMAGARSRTRYESAAVVSVLSGSKRHFSSPYVRKRSAIKRRRCWRLAQSLTPEPPSKIKSFRTICWLRTKT
jgi:hypothetical protein